MIAEDTVFILGAGASVPYGYPTGAELRNIICNQYQTIIGRDILKRAQPEIREKIVKEASEFASVFFRSSTPSIDLFLARNPSFEKLGKSAIIVSILSAERESEFRERCVAPEFDWYSYFFHRMTETIQQPEQYPKIADNKVTFISFNYDRSLEQFLYESMVNGFGDNYALIAGSNDVKYFHKPFPIHHVYGRLPKMEFEGDSFWRYKNPMVDAPIDKMINGIKVIYQRTNSSLNKIKNAILKAKRIFFLGFGFAQENLEVLGAPGIFDNAKIIHGTVKGLKDREIRGIFPKLRQEKELIHSIRRNGSIYEFGNIFLEDVDCKMLLRKHL